MTARQSWSGNDSGSERLYVKDTGLESVRTWYALSLGACLVLLNSVLCVIYIRCCSVHQTIYSHSTTSAEKPTPTSTPVKVDHPRYD